MRDIGRQSDAGTDGTQSLLTLLKSSCAPQIYRTVMTEPRAPVGLQPQPHLEDGSAYGKNRPA